MDATAHWRAEAKIESIESLAVLSLSHHEVYRVTSESAIHWESRLRVTANAATVTRSRRLLSTTAVAALSRRERAVSWLPKEQLESLQRRRIRAMVDHAFATVPFYRDLKARGFEPATIRTAADLSRLPMIDGSDLAADPMRFVCDDFRKSGREVFKTSGSTTGLRKPIFWDHGSLLLRAARGERDRVVIAALAQENWGAMIAREFMTTELRRTLSRAAGITTGNFQRLLILPADFSSRTQRTIYSERTVIPRRPVHYHHLPPTVPFDVVVAHFRALKPRVVFSFGSFVDQFLRQVKTAGIDIPLPRLWVYLGDRISSQCLGLADELGCTLYSVYGTMEAGTVGYQCEHRRGFHLNIDLCPVRIVGPDGREVEEGDVGEIVISPLDNRAMALLNYRLGDRGAMSTEECPCGRTLPLLGTMQGRQSEVLRLSHGREITTITVEALFGRELRNCIKAQIEQRGEDSLCWRLVAAAGVDRDALREAVQARGKQVLGPETILEVEFVDDIALTSAGKFRRAISGPLSADRGPAPAGSTTTD